MISNDLLLQFISVVDTGSLTKSADHFNVNPSSLSRSIKKLENEVGLSLFSHVGRNLEITTEGQRLYDFSKRNLQDFSHFITSLKSSATPATIFRIASFEVFSTYFITSFIKINSFQDPIQVLEKVPGELEDAILKKEADVGITYIPYPHPDLDHLKITKSELKVYIRKNSFKGVACEEIPFATPNTSLSLNVPGIESLDGWQKGLPRKVHYSFQQLQTAIETAKAGLCAIYIPEFLAKLINEATSANDQLVDISARFSGLKKNSIIIYLVKRRLDEENFHTKKLAKALRLATS